MPTITIRDLLPRVQQYRPDVVEEQCMWALKEAARDIARYSGLAEMVLAPTPLLANVDKQNVSAVNTNTAIQVKRVKTVRIAQLRNPSDYLGTWDADTNTPTLADSSWPTAFGFYIVTVAGDTSLGGVTTWNVGDILYSDGSLWHRYPLEEYATVWILNKPTVDRNTNHPQLNTDTPMRWSAKDDYVYFYPRPEFDYAVEYTVSYEPIGDFSTISMNTDAIDGIVYGALDFLYRLPGAGQDLKQAETWRIRFLKERANMKTLATYGDSGNTIIMPNNFLGRPSRLGPMRIGGGWL